MPNKKITELTDGGAPQAADELVVARSGDNYKIDFASLETEVLTNVVQDGDAAGGVLSGTYPNPGFAVDMATQAELDAVAAGAVILAPATSARNVIIPSVATAIGLTIKGQVAQSVQLFRVLYPDGTTSLEVDEDGTVFIQGPATPALADLLEVLTSAGNGLTIAFDGSAVISTISGSANAALKLSGAAAIPRILMSSGTLPADAFFAASQLGLWYDSTNGAAKFMLKGKTANGTVVTWTIPAFTGSTTTFMRADGTFAVPAGTGAPTTATYITQTPDGTLSAEQALSLLATGIVKNTTTTGVLSIAVQGTDYWAPGGTDVAVADGGTGASTAAGARTNLGAAPLDATYITQTANSELSGEQALSALATGIVKNTTATGVLSIAAQGTDYYAPGGTDVAVADGGTGSSTAAGALTNLGAAPENASFITTAAEAGLSAEKVLGTTVITSGLRSARPAAAVAGYLYFATNERVLYRDTGTAWVPLTLAPSFSAMPVTGAISDTLPRWACNSNNGPLNTGRLTLIPIWLPGDTTITSITFVSATTAANAPTHQIFGLFDDSAGSSGGSGYALLRATNDDTNTAWNADTAKTLNLTTTYATVRSGWFYLGIMVTATTPPTLTGAAAGGSKTGVLSIAPPYGGSSTTGLTTALPNPAAAPSANNAAPVYAYVS